MHVRYDLLQLWMSLSSAVYSLLHVCGDIVVEVIVVWSVCICGDIVLEVIVVCSVCICFTLIAFHSNCVQDCTKSWRSNFLGLVLQLRVAQLRAGAFMGAAGIKGLSDAAALLEPEQSAWCASLPSTVCVFGLMPDH